MSRSATCPAWCYWPVPARRSQHHTHQCLSLQANLDIPELQWRAGGAIWAGRGLAVTILQQQLATGRPPVLVQQQSDLVGHGPRLPLQDAAEQGSLIAHRGRPQGILVGHGAHLLLWDTAELGSIMGHWAHLLSQEVAEQGSLLVSTNAAALGARRVPSQGAPLSQNHQHEHPAGPQ